MDSRFYRISPTFLFTSDVPVGFYLFIYLFIYLFLKYQIISIFLVDRVSSADGSSRFFFLFFSNRNRSLPISSQRDESAVESITFRFSFCFSFSLHPSVDPSVFRRLIQMMKRSFFSFNFYLFFGSCRRHVQQGSPPVAKKNKQTKKTKKETQRIEKRAGLYCSANSVREFFFFQIKKKKE